MNSSLLLGIEGLTVDRVLIGDAGRPVEHCSTDPSWRGVVPGLPAAVVTEGLGDDPAGCADRPGPADPVVAQTPTQPDVSAPR